MKRQPIGQLIDRMLHLKDEKAKIATQKKTLDEEYDTLEAELLSRLDEEETTQGRSSTATATVSKLVVPTIQNWDAFEDYIKANEALYMLERRVSGATFRELIQQGEDIPGLAPFTKTSISLRRL